jgi:uncharacterized protein
MAETVDCPTCGRPVLIEPSLRTAQFPFCSERCRNRDLGAWFTGRYAVAGEPVEINEEQRAERDRLP